MAKRVTLSSLLLTLALLVLHSFAAPARAQEYRIRNGDTLRVEVIEDASLNRSVLVSPDGRITVPLAGSVTAAGRTVEQVQADLIAKMAPNFAAPPTVFVSLAQVGQAAAGVAAGPITPPVVNIYLLGEIGAPGKLGVGPGTTILQALAQAKGFTRFAATRRIQLRRVVDGVEKVYRLNYDAIVAGKSPNGNVVVMEGDVFIVPQRRLFE